MALTEQTLVIDEFEVYLKRSRRRSLSLEITPLGVQARAPMRMTQKDIRAFVRSKRSWLLKHLARRPMPLAPLNLEHGSSIPFKGHAINLHIEVATGGAAIKNSQQLYLPVKNSNVPIEQSIRNKLLKWYRQQSLAMFEDLVQQLAPQMNLDPSMQIKVRDYKRRWGSCDDKGNLSFNWRLIMAPYSVARYVAVHELAHRHEFNHSPRFWQIVEQHQADWRIQRDWLYEQSTQLYRL